MIRNYSGMAPPESVEDVANRYHGLIFGIANRILRNREDAEDAVQEVYIKLMRRLESYDRGCDFATWLYTMAKNAAVDRFRQRKNDPLRSSVINKMFYEDSDIGPVLERLGIRTEDANVSYERALDARSLYEKIYRAGLKELLLHAYGFRYDEIAQELGLPEGTVKSRINRQRELAKFIARKSEIEDKKRMHR